MKSNLIEQKPIVFVKIGGSLITDKIKPFTLKEQALEGIFYQIKTPKK